MVEVGIGLEICLFVCGGSLTYGQLFMGSFKKACNGRWKSEEAREESAEGWVWEIETRRLFFFFF